MEEEYLKRWRLILGGNEADGTGITLTQEEQRIDQSLEAVYNSDRPPRRSLSVSYTHLTLPTICSV